MSSMETSISKRLQFLPGPRFDLRNVLVAVLWPTNGASETSSRAFSYFALSRHEAGFTVHGNSAAFSWMQSEIVGMVLIATSPTCSGCQFRSVRAQLQPRGFTGRESRQGNKLPYSQT